MCGTYKIEFSYIQDGRRVKETDIFYGRDTQEAVDICRADDCLMFSEHFGRIEGVWKECQNSWEYREDWE